MMLTGNTNSTSSEPDNMTYETKLMNTYMYTYTNLYIKESNYSRILIDL